MNGEDHPLQKAMRRTGAALGRGLRLVWGAVATVVRIAWPVLRTVLRRVFEVVLALILLFEEWGWRPLAAALARLARFPLVARIEARVATLPPYGALAAFAAPSILILPLKLIALYLIAGGHAISAAALFIGAKVAGTAIVARLFMLTKPKLMQIGWFASAHDWLMPWKDRMFAKIRESWAWRYGRIVKYRVGQAVKARWREWRPSILALRDRAVAQARSLIARFTGRRD